MKISIIGASGHGKVVADIAEKNGYDEIEFFDDDENLSSCGKWPVVGTINQAYGREIRHTAERMIFLLLSETPKSDGDLRTAFRKSTLQR